MSREGRPRVLVTGASIAGPALAWGLERAGFDVTVLERSPQQRDTGQNIDIRSIGRTAIRRMGVEGAVLANLTGEQGTRFVCGAQHSPRRGPRPIKIIRPPDY